MSEKRVTTKFKMGVHIFSWMANTTVLRMAVPGEHQRHGAVGKAQGSNFGNLAELTTVVNSSEHKLRLQFMIDQGYTPVACTIKFYDRNLRS